MGDFFSWERFFAAAPVLLPYFIDTFYVVLWATLGGCLLGSLVTFIRIKKVPVLDRVVVLWISFMRGTPMLVQLYLVLYGLPLIVEPVLGVNLGRIWDRPIFAYVTFIINQAAYLSVIFKNAVEAVPKGQYEAGISVGLTGFQCVCRVLVPQALRIGLPPFCSDLVGVFENSSLVFTIGVIDLMGRAQSHGTQTGHALEGYFFVALVYIVVSILIRVTAAFITKKQNHTLKALG